MSKSLIMQKLKNVFHSRERGGPTDFNNSPTATASQNSTKDTEPTFNTEHQVDLPPTYGTVPSLFVTMKQAHQQHPLEAVSTRHQQVIIDDNYRLDSKVKDTILYAAHLIHLAINLQGASSSTEFMGYSNDEDDENMEDDEKLSKERLKTLFMTKNRNQARKLLNSWPTPLPITLQNTVKHFDSTKHIISASTSTIAHNEFLSLVRQQLSEYHCGWETSQVNTSLMDLYSQAQAHGKTQQLYLNSLCFTLDRILESIEVLKVYH